MAGDDRLRTDRVLGSESIQSEAANPQGHSGLFPWLCVAAEFGSAGFASHLSAQSLPESAAAKVSRARHHRPRYQPHIPAASSVPRPIRNGSTLADERAQGVL